MQLWFDDMKMRDRFIALCKERGISGVAKTTTGTFRYQVTANVEGKEKEALTAEWSRRTIIRQN